MTAVARHLHPAYNAASEIVAVPVTVTAVPAVTVAPGAGETIWETGEAVSVDFVSRISPGWIDAGCDAHIRKKVKRSLLHPEVCGRRCRRTRVMVLIQTPRPLHGTGTEYQCATWCTIKLRR